MKNGKVINSEELRDEYETVRAAMHKCTWWLYDQPQPIAVCLDSHAVLILAGLALHRVKEIEKIVPGVDQSFAKKFRCSSEIRWKIRWTRTKEAK